jgi:hypothetical protein
MFTNVGVVRDHTGLAVAIEELIPLAIGGSPAADPAAVALMIATAALQRFGEPRKPLSIGLSAPLVHRCLAAAAQVR